MKYINNISINLTKDLINFYEWTDNDKIIKYKKVCAIRISNEKYNKLLKYRIKIDKSFLLSITDNICIFCSEYDSICIKFDNDGNSIFYSKLLLEDEIDILELLSKEKCTRIKYSITDKLNYSFNSRDINNKINEIISFINDNKSNKDLIGYIEYEWFNNNKNNIDLLVESIMYSEIDKINKLYETITFIKINA